MCGMPDVTVRPLTDVDDVTALTADSPMPWQIAWWQELEQSGGVDIRWLVGELDGEPVGLGAVCPMPVAAGGYGPAVVTVLRGARRRGVATALRRELELLATGIVPGVAYTHLIGDAEGAAAFEAWGLAIGTVHRESVLDLTAVDRADFERRASLEGVVVESLPDLDTIDDATWHHLHDFVQDRFREAPDSAGGGGLLPYEVFRGSVTAPSSMSTARQDGELVGFTFVSSRPGDDAARNTFFTGVVERARGRGVATALKCQQALAMLDDGIERLYTQNMTGNEPILAANRALGFEYALSYADVPVPLDDSTASTSTS
jgi:RimJ/RimL family protein N-acetyltransferase